MCAEGRLESSSRVTLEGRGWPGRAAVDFSALIPICCAGKLSVQCCRAAGKGRADGEILQKVFQCSLGSGERLGTRKRDPLWLILAVGREVAVAEQLLLS